MAHVRLPTGITLGNESAAAPVSPPRMARFRFTGTALQISLDGAAYTTIGGVAGGSGVWSALTLPTANLSLAMAAYTTDFLWNAATGAATDLFTLRNTTDDTGTGSILAIKTPGSANAKQPFQITARDNSTWAITTTGQQFQTVASTTVSPFITLERSRGILSSRDYLSAGDVVGSLNFGSFIVGFSGNQNQISARIRAEAGATHTNTVWAGDLTFATANTSVPINRMRITADGFVGIGSSPLASNIGLTALRLTTNGVGVKGLVLDTEVNSPVVNLVEVLANGASNPRFIITGDKLCQLGFSGATPKVQVSSDGSTYGYNVKINCWDASTIGQMILAAPSQLVDVFSLQDSAGSPKAHWNKDLKFFQLPIASFGHSSPVAQVDIKANAADVIGLRVNSQASATAALLDLQFNATTKVQIVPLASGLVNSVFGSAALGTADIGGFLYLPSCPGTPTGAATAYTGMIGVVVDSTNGMLYGRIGSVWTSLTGGSGGGGTPGGGIGTLQYKVDSTTFGGVTSSAVSGANITLGGDVLVSDGETTLSRTSNLLTEHPLLVSGTLTGGDSSANPYYNSKILFSDSHTSSALDDTSALWVTYNRYAFGVWAQASGITSEMSLTGTAATTTSYWKSFRAQVSVSPNANILTTWAGFYASVYIGNATVNNQYGFIAEPGLYSGFGTTTPTATLHVSGTVKIDLGSDVAGDAYYRNSLGRLVALHTAGRSAGDVLTLAGSPLLPTWAAASAGSSKWNALTAPDGNLSLSMAAFGTDIGWSAATGAGDKLIFYNGVNDTGTGSLIVIKTFGTTNTKQPFQIVTNDKAQLDAFLGGSEITRLTGAGVAPNIQMVRAGGVLSGKTAVPSGSTIGILNFAGHLDSSGTNIAPLAAVAAVAGASTFTTSNWPTGLHLRTSNTDILPRTRLAITPAGLVGIGSNLAFTDVTATLHLNGTLKLDNLGLGVDATGDMIFRSAGGEWRRLGIGVTNDSLRVVAGLPFWGVPVLVWNGLATPAGNLALSMASFTTDFTWGATTGVGVNLMTLATASNNTGTGTLFSLSTPGISNATRPFAISARGIEVFSVAASGAPSFTPALNIVGDGISGFLTISTWGTGLFPVFNIIKGNGSNAAPTRVNSGDVLGSIPFYGQYGSTAGESIVGNYTLGASIVAQAAGTFSGTSNKPTDLLFKTDSTAHVTGMILTSTSQVVIGAGVTNADALAQLTVKGDAQFRSLTGNGYFHYSPGTNNTQHFYQFGTAFTQNELIFHKASAGEGNSPADDAIATMRFQARNAGSYVSVAEIAVGQFSTGNVWQLDVGANRFALYSNSCQLNITGNGTDATGDVYYRNSGGRLTARHPTTNGFVLTLVGGIPDWVAASGGSTVPGPSPGNLQYNNGGIFGGVPNTSVSGNVITVTDAFNVTSNAANATLRASSFGGGIFPVCALQRGNNTAANPFVAGSGDRLGELQFNGQWTASTPGAVATGASISAAAVGVFSSGTSSAPTDMIFATRSTFEGGVRTGMLLTSTRRVGVGLDILSASITHQLTVTGTVKLDLVPGFDAQGDIYYRASDGTFTRLAISGTVGMFLKSNGTIPGWSNLSTADLQIGTLAIARGGTGTTTAPTSGSLLIGTSGGAYNVAALSAGANVTITNTSGGITIAATGGGTTLAQGSTGNLQYNGGGGVFAGMSNSTVSGANLSMQGDLTISPGRLQVSYSTTQLTNWSLFIAHTLTSSFTQSSLYSPSQIQLDDQNTSGFSTPSRAALRVRYIRSSATDSYSDAIGMISEVIYGGAGTVSTRQIGYKAALSINQFAGSVPAWVGFWAENPQGNGIAVNRIGFLADPGMNSGFGTSTPVAPLHLLAFDGTIGAQRTDLLVAATSTINTLNTYDLQSSGVPLLAFGGRTVYRLESSTTTSRDAVYQDWRWQNATDATRSAVYSIKTYAPYATPVTPFIATTPGERWLVGGYKPIVNNTRFDLFTITYAATDHKAAAGTMFATIIVRQTVGSNQTQITRFQVPFLSFHNATPNSGEGKWGAVSGGESLKTIGGAFPFGITYSVNTVDSAGGATPATTASSFAFQLTVNDPSISTFAEFFIMYDIQMSGTIDITLA